MADRPAAPLTGLVHGGGVDGALERADEIGLAGWLPRGERRAVRLDGVCVGVVTADQARADLRPVGGAAFEYWFAAPVAGGAEIGVDGLPSVRLPGRPAAAAAAGCWRADAGAPLALFVDAHIPVPARDAGANAALSHIAALGRLGFRVRVGDPASMPRLLAEEAGRVRLAYFHRLPSVGWLGPVRAVNRGVRTVFGLADLHCLRARRRAAVDGTQAPANIAAAEIGAARRVDVVLTHSCAEADFLAADGVLARVVPWEQALPPRRGGHGEAVALLGHFGHAPNEDAARWLLEAVMPLVWRQHPDVPVVIAGRGLPDWLRDWPAPVRLMPDVADLDALWQRTRLAVAPLRYGAGLKGKVLDACAAGVACLCTPVAAEGFPPGLVPVAAAVPAAFARAVSDLLASRGRRRRYAACGPAYVAAACNARAVDQALASAIGVIAPGRLSAPL